MLCIRYAFVFLNITWCQESSSNVNHPQNAQNDNKTSRPWPQLFGGSKAPAVNVVCGRSFHPLNVHFVPQPCLISELVNKMDGARQVGESGIVPFPVAGQVLPAFCMRKRVCFIGETMKV